MVLLLEETKEKRLDAALESYKKTGAIEATTDGEAAKQN